MFARGGKILVVMALVLMTGAHWVALQTVAWTTMLAENLCHDSVAESVSKTFDGEHPCCLCKAIAAAKKSEKKSEAVSPTLKIEFLPAPENFTLIAPEPVSAFSLVGFFAGSFFSKPPLPPPRNCFA
jgi:hypothetical protein